MQYPHGSSRVTGVLTPLAAISSRQSIGCGEFADLIPLGRWCASNGVGLIQLLPVNDTGGQSSPYSALSAFALHPIYCRISDLPEYAALTGKKERSALENAIAEARQTHGGRGRFKYESVLMDKLRLLRLVYDTSGAARRSITEIGAFIAANPWVKPYAAFRYLREKFGRAAWSQWPSHREGTPTQVAEIWSDTGATGELHWHCWVQMRLAGQLHSAAMALDALGVALKGDIPILMNEDSADVWANRTIFNTSLRAGAPPDMFSHLGQNWDFPIYDWAAQERDDFAWWRERLRVAAQFYHAYRIDHVLGFFRIWAIPQRNFSGIPGFFWPQRGLTREDLQEIGFDDGRIRWLAEPHLPGHRLREVLGESWSRIDEGVFEQIGNEDLYLFGPLIRGEMDIEHLGLNRERTEYLLAQFRNRALIRLPDGTSAATWTFHSCDRFTQLFEDEKERFRGLVAQAAEASNELWAQRSRYLLRVMKESTSMLTCAEDLGVVPEAVPRVLAELEILSLYIPRWAHYWDQPRQPSIPLKDYRSQSVCAPSVHDTSTVRSWWEQESGRDVLWASLGGQGPAPERFVAATAQRVYRGLAGAASQVFILQIQDLLVFEPAWLHPDPTQERINVPGTFNDFNWTYRLPVDLEEFVASERIGGELAAIVRERIEPSR